ncbi:hypothetical protein GCM10009845_21010 [Pedococcus bigeumensis]
MLQFSVLNDYAVPRPVAIDRESTTRPVLPGVAQEPVEQVLARPDLPQQLVTQLEDVLLITRLSSHGAHRSERVTFEPPPRRFTVRLSPGRIKSATRHCVMASGHS